MALWSAKRAASGDEASVSPDGPASGVHERSREERSLVMRLDLFLMVYGCISQIIKYLDQAYVSGMKEDLSLYGNELNYFTTWFSVGYCIMLIPSQIIMTHVRPSLWLPGLEIVWGVMTGLIATCHSAKQIYALRAFLGLCESSAWPGMMTLLMNWYTPTELAKRMGFYHSCQAIGSMMSNALQTAMHETLDGKAGLAGWRWMFIINAVMTVVVGLFGFFLIPDYPNRRNPLAFWFTKADAALAMERLERHNRAEPKRMDLKAIKRTFSSWMVYFITILYTATVLASWGYAYFSLWLKSLKNPDGSQRWDVAHINVIPIGGQAIQVAFVWIWAFLSDYFKNRHWLIVAQSVIGLVPAIIMSVWNVPDSAKYFSYFISYVPLGTAPLIMSWLSDLIPQDPEQRALVVGVAIAIYYAISAWSQVLIWPAKEAPHYSFGWQVSIALWILVIGMTVALRHIDLRYLLPKRQGFKPNHDDAKSPSPDEEDDIQKKAIDADVVVETLPVNRP
ncbi:major facilitator superfamily domain-containing protein [Schizophyllum commune]